MIDYLKQNALSLVNTVLVVLLLVSLNSGVSFGAYDRTTIGNPTTFTGTVQIGSGGSSIGTIIKGTCYLQADFSIAASSTAMVDCVSSSFVSGDIVIIGGIATSSTALTRQFTIVGTGTASTTAGYAPVRVTNWTGAAATPASLSGFGSSTPFVLIRN